MKKRELIARLELAVIIEYSNCLKRRYRMKKIYPVIFTQTEKEVLVEVPDLDIYTQGTSMLHAIEMARDAIGLHGITMEDLGQELSETTFISEVDVSKGKFAECGLGIVSMVDVDFTEYRRRVDTKAVRRNVTLPNWLNREVEKAHINVSRVLQEALLAQLGYKMQ